MALGLLHGCRRRRHRALFGAFRSLQCRQPNLLCGDSAARILFFDKWSELDASRKATRQHRPRPQQRHELSVVPGRNEMYVWYMDVSGGFDIEKGIWKTTDGGNNWTSISTAGIDCQNETGCGVAQGAYNLMLAALPNAAGTDLYAGAVNLFKCSIN